MENFKITKFNIIKCVLRYVFPMHLQGHGQTALRRTGASLVHSPQSADVVVAWRLGHQPGLPLPSPALAP
jgi:hypothetical protein